MGAFKKLLIFFGIGAAVSGGAALINQIDENRANAIVSTSTTGQQNWAGTYTTTNTTTTEDKNSITTTTTTTTITTENTTTKDEDFTLNP